MDYLYHFTGAGNSFIILDGRCRNMDVYREAGQIGRLCKQFHTDGLMILDTDPELDFSMDFFNPDGSGGMMCGNGGRCIVAFADYLGIPSHDDIYHFRAPDGPHLAKLLERPEIKPGEGLSFPKWTVRLKMIDVKGVTPMKGGYFLNTGTRHFVKFVQHVDGQDMDAVAKPLRWDPAFAPIGTNVNLVEVATDGLHVRTYEKGVEGETLACGTGITASAIAAYVANGIGTEKIQGQALNDGDNPSRHNTNGGQPPFPHVQYRLQCRRGDWLSVDFHPSGPDCFEEVFLTGPAELLRITESTQSE